MRSPEYFCDEMAEGDFGAFKHEHYFDSNSEGTIMRDVIQFKSPYGIMGTILNKIYLSGYLKRLLIKRNQCIKQYAESDEWKTILDNKYF